MSMVSNAGYIGIGVQSAKGTQQDTPEWYPKFKGADKFTSEQPTENLREAGDGELVGATIKTGAREKWGFDGVARPEFIARVFAYLFGTDTVTGAADPYTHTLTRVASKGRAWLSVHRKLDSAVVQILKDAKVSKITVKGEAGKEISVSVEGEALSSSLTTSETVAAYETLSPFVYYDAAGKMTLETGTIVKTIKSWQITVTVAGEVLQTDELYFNDITDQRFDIDVQIQLYPDDTDYVAKSIYGSGAGTTLTKTVYSSEFEVDMSYQEDTGEYREFKINIPKFLWKPVAGFNLDSDGKTIAATIAGIAVKPDAGEIITVTALCDVSAEINP